MWRRVKASAFQSSALRRGPWPSSSTVSSIGSEAGGSMSGEPGWPSGTEGMSSVPSLMTSPERAEGAGTAGMSGS